MKKIILVCLVALFVQVFVKTAASADEILDSKGNITPCRIETVCDGLIEYHKDGKLYKFARSEDDLVYNDYVDVRDCLYKRDSVKRYTGKIITKDMWSVRLRDDNGEADIPFYKIKFIGIYKP